MSRLRSLFCVLLAVVLCAVVALPSLAAALSAAPALAAGVPLTSAMISGPQVVVFPSGLVGVFLTRAKDAAIEWFSSVLDVVFGTDEDGDDGDGDPVAPEEPVENAGVLLLPEG